MVNSNKVTVALAGRSKSANKNSCQSYFADDTKRIKNKDNGKNGRNFMPPRFMNALLLVILCVVLKNEYTYENEAELRTDASRQLSEMRSYSKGPKNKKCTGNDRYDFPDEQFNNMRQGGMGPRGRDPRSQMSHHDGWDGERGPHNPGNRDMNMGMQRDAEHSRRRNRNRGDVDEEMDMERGDRRRNRNRGEMDEEMERNNRRRRGKGRDMDREDGGDMDEEGREMVRGRDRDEMVRGRDRDEMGRGRERDEMVRGRDRDEMVRGRERDEMGRGRERDEMGRGRDRDEMLRGRERDEMGRGRDRDEMLRGRDRDEMVRGRDRDEMVRGRDRDEMLRGKDRDEMLRGRDRDEMLRGRDRDEMFRGRDRDDMGRRRDRGEKGRGREKGKEEMDDENGENPEMHRELGREVGKIMGRADIEREMERKRRGKGRDMDEEEDRDKRRGKGRDMDEEEDKDRRRGKGRDMDMQNGTNKTPNANKDMPPGSDVKGLDTTNIADIKFHVTEAEIAQMIDKLEDYVKFDDMFLLFNLVNNNEKIKYIKMQLGAARLCETLAQTYKIPHYYKTRQWTKAYQGMSDQLLRNEKNAYNKLCTFLQSGNSSHIAFIEFLNELIGIWTGFTKEMEKHWKEYLTSKFNTYWETTAKS
ncbi:hypothetical protein C922_05276 [Plasmodium inui San Antonio 1]|uniref:Plasmodium RESA N-terminal domain-containing protein n=1 Tax=Plasmodium inui San Antonio 1 TaxID=1237626 RepID=W6ZTT6_9APIC|nr:hypothetical protein C922_05276 [Plasmodium inui San Antonio 1]EUD64337.1 hypothetical protein C922_05276 [Plasmodium inui San Antonio 1]